MFAVLLKIQKFSFCLRLVFTLVCAMKIILCAIRSALFTGNPLQRNLFDPKVCDFFNTFVDPVKDIMYLRFSTLSAFFLT